MADYNIDEIVRLVKAALLAESQGVGEVPVVSSLDGINSLPALKNGNQVVEAPLELLSEPAVKAAEDAYKAIENVDEAAAAANAAASGANAAAESANEASTRVDESVLDLTTEKEIIAGVAEAEEGRVAAEQGRVDAESTRVASENTRISSENARSKAETDRNEAEVLREEAERLRIANENERETQETSRQTAETDRRASENERKQLKVEMDALNKGLKENPPIINDEGNWEVWDAVTGEYHDTGKTALGKSPIIVSGNWWIWNDGTDQYEDTGWSVSSDYQLRRENVESVLGGIPAFYIEEWKHTDVPFRSGSIVKFNQEFYSALKDTSVPPVPLLLLGEGIIAKVDEHTYATKGSYDAEGNKEDWRKIPYDELRLSSRYGTLNGEEVDVRTLANAEEVYQLEPNLYIDLLRGILKAKKVDFPNLPKKNVTDALGYVPLSEARIDQLFDEDALDVLQGSDVLAIESNGKKATVTVDMLKSFFNTYDLSRHDIYGNTIKQTTANCYVVKEKGYYSFPLVYGNALKDGEVNTPAFTKVEGTYSMDFVNHLDNVITSPYIEQHEGCQPVSVELSLCDTKDVFGAFRLVGKDDCTYVEFEVINVPKTGANGVVSIIDANGDAIWSWHIWLWEDDLTPVTITNATNVNYDILPVNLASKWDEDSKTHIKNWFYQWGRHIPMLSPSAYNSNTDAANYGKRTFGKVSKAASYGVGLKKPWNFYYNGSTIYNWFGSSVYFNLWDADCVSTGRSDNNVVKTVYDPCPIDFKIPNGNIFTGFSIDNVIGSFNYGWKFKANTKDTKGVFFPCSGYRLWDTGSLTSVSVSGYLWHSSNKNAERADSIGFGQSNVTVNYSFRRAYSFSVRPVKE